jgi:hypothetical protein
MKTVKHVKNFEGFTINESTQDQFMLAIYQRGDSSGYICIKESTLDKLGFTPEKNPGQTTFWSSPEFRDLVIYGDMQQSEKFATYPIILATNPTYVFEFITEEQAYAILKAGGVFNPNGGLFEFKMDDPKTKNASKLAGEILGSKNSIPELDESESFFVWMPVRESAIIPNSEDVIRYIWSPEEVSLEDFLADENY